jgi:hypothetical protein
MIWINFENIILGEKPVIKGFILYNSVYIERPEWGIHSDSKKINGSWK